MDRTCLSARRAPPLSGRHAEAAKWDVVRPAGGLPSWRLKVGPTLTRAQAEVSLANPQTPNSPPEKSLSVGPL